MSKSKPDELVAVESNTFEPTTGSEVGLPHHIFTPGEFGALSLATDLPMCSEAALVLQ